MHASFKVLFHRHEKNPILTARDWPYPVHSVFNAGATKLDDGTTLLLCRVEDRRGISHLAAARSRNGVDGWEIDPEPTFKPEPEQHPEELWGLEDPRITYLPDEKLYVIAYTAFGKSGPGVALATTKNFKSFKRLGLVMQPEDKDAALFPQKFDGNYVLIHRPVAELGCHIWISYSPDLYNWGQHKLLLPARRGAWWDANKIGLSPPPIKTDRGWLVMYHGVRHHASGSLYRLGLALFDLDDPEICLRRGQSWMFGPEEQYEMVGDVGGVVFPCGYTVEEDGDTINLYYGAADTCIALARGSIQEMLDWLQEDGTELTGVAGQHAERVELSTPV
ncbi:MAG: glycosidase [Armatimonadetes bacterium 55-13]|nr:MAG: glycosidase [Armatimonadetes bacterium 55-13]